VLVLDMIGILPPLGKYKYDVWRILLVKSYIDNFVRLWSCIRNVNNLPLSLRFTEPHWQERPLMRVLGASWQMPIVLKGAMVARLSIASHNYLQMIDKRSPGASNGGRWPAQRHQPSRPNLIASCRLTLLASASTASIQNMWQQHASTLPAAFAAIGKDTRPTPASRP
jgi:hypothetical protein